jgi:hypothetical protein
MRPNRPAAGSQDRSFLQPLPSQDQGPPRPGQGLGPAVEPTGQVSNSVRPSRSNLSPSFDFHSEAFGHWIEKKKDCFWIVAGNLGGFPAKATDEKNNALWLYIEDLDADVIAMSETSRAWHLVSVGDRMPERTFGWYQAIYIASSYYKSYKRIPGNSVWWNYCLEQEHRGT